MSLNLDPETAKQLFLSGLLNGYLDRKDKDPRHIQKIVELIDPDKLQAYLDRKPEEHGFLYRDSIQRVIRTARTLKSFLRSKG